ncbi:MAG: hypothetical protein RI885_953 [Actinomycetota bacterium]
MPRDQDSDALEWEDGSDDPTYLRSEAAAAAAAGEGSDDPGAARRAEADILERTDDRPGGGIGSALLVVYGVFAGVYLLYTVGWIVGVQRDTFTSTDLFFEVMYQFGEFLGIASPALWFALTLLLTRERAAVVRLAWLIIGMLVVAPIPFLVSGAGA